MFPVRRSRRLLLSLCVLACGVTAAPASAIVPACGDAISADTVLTGDLAACAGDALTVTTDGATLDLGGRTLTGGPGSQAAVRVPPGVDGVRIVNGTITGFPQGVVVDSAAGAVIRNVRLQGNERGIDLANASATQVSRNVVSGPGADGIRVDGAGATGNRIEQNRVTGRVWGIMVSGGASGTRVDGNVVSGNEHGIVVWEVSDTTLTRNFVDRSADNGIRVVEGAQPTVLRANAAQRNGGDGIDVEGAGSQLSWNVAVSNRGHGINAPLSARSFNLAWGNATSPQCVGVVC